MFSHLPIIGGVRFFDMGLIGYLEKLGKTVFYAVKEHPVQNDGSFHGRRRTVWFRKKIFPNIISTGNRRSRYREDDLGGKVSKLRNGDGIIIAKGMGNYETISEFHEGRPVIYITRVKCPSCSRGCRKNVGAIYCNYRWWRKWQRKKIIMKYSG